MFRIVEDFTTYPSSVKTGLVLLLIGWIWFYVVLAVIAGIKIDNRMLIMGLSVLLLAGSMKSWARMLCMMGNGMALLFCLFFAVDVYRLTRGQGVVLAITLVSSAVLFMLSIYYMAVKPSAEFYKVYNHIDSEQQS